MTHEPPEINIDQVFYDTLMLAYMPGLKVDFPGFTGYLEQIEEFYRSGNKSEAREMWKRLNQAVAAAEGIEGDQEWIVP